MGADGLGTTRAERFRHGDFSVSIFLPESSEALIDEEAFDLDERLPYWAELWPSAKALARYLLDLPSIQGPALELGSGVALPSLAMAGRGVSVTATDYYEAALRFAAFNAEFNQLHGLETRLLDWRDPPGDPYRFPLIAAADVLYESRNADALSALLPQLVADGGTVIIADPGRVYLCDFLDRMRKLGWSVEQVGQILEDSSGGSAIKTTVKLFALRLPS